MNPIPVDSHARYPLESVTVKKLLFLAAIASISAEMHSPEATVLLNSFDAKGVPEPSTIVLGMPSLPSLGALFLCRRNG